MRKNKWLFVACLLLSEQAVAVEKYNDFNDAAVAQAKLWQSGGKAHSMISSDGKVIFPFGQSMPKLTCSPSRACDVEMEPDEKVKTVVLGDGVNWTWNGAESMESGKTIRHVIFQPHDVDLESNVIIFTDRRTYHIKLFAPLKEGAYLNRVGFYYPQELVTTWTENGKIEEEEKVKKDSLSVMKLSVPADKLDFEYRSEGRAEFAPVRVFNDGERTYLEMPDSIRTGESPVLVLIDEKKQVMVVNYRRVDDPESGKIHYVVDKLFAECELRMGSDSVHIFWKKKEKSFWNLHGFGRGAS